MACPDYVLDGYETSEMTEEYAPDIVLMDIMMPGMDGLEATQRVLKVRPEMLVIIFSAYAEMDKKAYEAGAIDFLLMPVKPEVLFNTIRRIYKEQMGIYPFT